MSLLRSENHTTIDFHHKYGAIGNDSWNIKHWTCKNQNKLLAFYDAHRRFEFMARTHTDVMNSWQYAHRCYQFKPRTHTDVMSSWHVRTQTLWVQGTYAHRRYEFMARTHTDVMSSRHVRTQTLWVHGTYTQTLWVQGTYAHRRYEFMARTHRRYEFKARTHTDVMSSWHVYLRITFNDASDFNIHVLLDISLQVHIWYSIPTAGFNSLVTEDKLYFWNYGVRCAVIWFIETILQMLYRCQFRNFAVFFW